MVVVNVFVEKQEMLIQNSAYKYVTSKNFLNRRFFVCYNFKTYEYYKQ